ncbi:hypothetical protein TSAR_013648, partial [Trichomalopsis sarcophagae]
FSYTNDDRGGAVYVVAWCLYALFFFVNDDCGGAVYVIAWYSYALGFESESQQIFFFYLLIKYTAYNNNAIYHSASAIIFQFSSIICSNREDDCITLDKVSNLSRVTSSS